MAKPFSIQAPEEIAKQYAGNKQQIAAAMQMGVVDPTAGVLAGMFIDRMRAAQMQEQAPQATIAQQVMGGAPPAQPAAPAPAPASPSPGGLGATPQAAPPMAPPMPQMPAAPQMPQGPGMAAGGMVPPYASGGLSDVPVPDTMFDEPSNGGFDDGYGGGGLVAFAGGSPGELRDPSDWGSYIEQMALGVYPDIGVTSRQRSVAKNRLVDGVTDSYHLLGAARDFKPPKGMTMGQLHAQLKQKFGSGYDVINEGDHVHIEPGPALGRVVRAGTPFNPANAGMLRKAEDRSAPRGAPAAVDLGATAAAGDWGGSLLGQMDAATAAGEADYAKRIPERTNEGLNLLTAEARKVLDPAEQKKRRDEDKWMTLAEIGFKMASSNSPYLLQAVGAAAAAALPGAREDKKAREAAKREAIRDLAAAEDITYKQALDKANYVRGFAKDRLDVLDKDMARRFTQKQTEAELKSRETVANIGAQASRDVAGINAESYQSYGDKQTAQQIRQAYLKAPELAQATAQQDKNYQQAMRTGDQAGAQAILNQYTQYYLQQMGVGGGGAEGGKMGVMDFAQDAMNKVFGAGQGRGVSQGRIVNAVPIPR